MGKAKKLGTQTIVLGEEDSENFTKPRALWQRSVVVRRYEGNAETGRLVEDYRAEMFRIDAPQNELELWQHTGTGLQLLGVLPSDFWEWTTDDDLMAWVGACYQSSPSAYDRVVREIGKKARAAYRHQNGEPAPF